MSTTPFDDQRALLAGRAVVPLLGNGVLTITGPDRLSWLDSMTSQSIRSRAPGESAETLLLDPSGRIEHAMRVVDDGETLWVLVDPAEAAPLAAFLNRMRFMLRVAVADVSADFHTVGFFGADAPAGSSVVWRDPWRSVAPGGWQYAAHTPSEGWDYAEALLPRDAPVAEPVARPEALDALRIAAWRPRAATELDATAIPHEFDWLRSAVHLDKGCYRGQETVAKVHNLGHPPRRLVMLHLDGSDNVYAAPGDAVMLGEVQVGRVTSAAVHHELGPIALAIVKRNTDAAATLTVEHEGTALAAAQEIIVPADAGATVEVPRIPRLGAARSSAAAR